jgi:hypothetical protein
MPSDRVEQAVELLTVGVSIPQLEQTLRVELTADQWTAVLTRLSPLAQHQWTTAIRALIEQRRARETASAARC